MPEGSQEGGQSWGFKTWRQGPRLLPDAEASGIASQATVVGNICIALTGGSYPHEFHEKSLADPFLVTWRLPHLGTNPFAPVLVFSRGPALCDGHGNQPVLVRPELYSGHQMGRRAHHPRPLPDCRSLRAWWFPGLGRFRLADRRPVRKPRRHLAKRPLIRVLEILVAGCPGGPGEVPFPVSEQGAARTVSRSTGSPQTVKGGRVMQEGKDGTHVVAYTVATIGWAMVGGRGPVQLLLTPRAAVKGVR